MKLLKTLAKDKERLKLLLNMLNNTARNGVIESFEEFSRKRFKEFCPTWSQNFSQCTSVFLVDFSDSGALKPQVCTAYKPAAVPILSRSSLTPGVLQNVAKWSAPTPVNVYYMNVTH